MNGCFKQAFWFCLSLFSDFQWIQSLGPGLSNYPIKVLCKSKLSFKKFPFSKIILMI